MEEEVNIRCQNVKGIKKNVFALILTLTNHNIRWFLMTKLTDCFLEFSKISASSANDDGQYNFVKLVVGRLRI